MSTSPQISAFLSGYKHLVAAEEGLIEEIVSETSKLTAAGTPVESSDKLTAWGAALRDLRKIRVGAEEDLKKAGIPVPEAGRKHEV